MVGKYINILLLIYLKIATKNKAWAAENKLVEKQRENNQYAPFSFNVIFRKSEYKYKKTS